MEPTAEEDAGVDEAGEALRVAEAEADGGETGVVVKGAAVDVDLEEADSDVTKTVNTG